MAVIQTTRIFTTRIFIRGRYPSPLDHLISHPFVLVPPNNLGPDGRHRFHLHSGACGQFTLQVKQVLRSLAGSA